MVIVHNFRNRKPSGARYKKTRSKRLGQTGNLPTHTRIEERKTRTRKSRGSSPKVGLVSDESVNVYDPKTKKISVVKFSNVEENPASRHFIRRNIVTKGAILETEKGKVRVTSRPGQDGVINAILIK